MNVKPLSDRVLIDPNPPKKKPLVDCLSPTPQKRNPSQVKLWQ